MKYHALIFINSLLFTPLLHAQPLIQPPLMSISSQHLTATNPNFELDKIEASGIVWLPDSKQYLLVSDEAYNDEPGLFALNSDGLITHQVTLPKKINMDDLESISSDGEHLYILSSLAHNKHDELKTKRKQLLRFKFKDNDVKHAETIDLYDILTTLHDEQPTSLIAQFLASGFKDHSLDIEAHFVKNNALYFGFKSPLNAANATVILKLNNLNTLFDGKVPQAEIWQTLPLLDPLSKQPTQLSDLLRIEDHLYLLSGANTLEKNSFLWRYSLTDNNLQLLTTFAGLKAEGITYREDLSQLMVVFDEGKGNPSKYALLPFGNFAH